MSQVWCMEKSLYPCTRCTWLSGFLEVYEAVSVSGLGFSQWNCQNQGKAIIVPFTAFVRWDLSVTWTEFHMKISYSPLNIW